MPKRNYQYEKRQKDLDKKRKREEKRQRKVDRAQNRAEEIANHAPDPLETPPQEGAAHAAAQSSRGPGDQHPRSDKGWGARGGE